MKVYLDVDQRSADAHASILFGLTKATRHIEDSVNAAITSYQIRRRIVRDILWTGIDHEFLAGSQKGKIVTISPMQQITDEVKKQIVDIMVDLDSMRWEAKGLINKSGKPNTAPMSREAFRKRRRGVWNTAVNAVQLEVCNLEILEPLKDSLSPISFSPSKLAPESATLNNDDGHRL